MSNTPLTDNAIWNTKPSNGPEFVLSEFARSLERHARAIVGAADYLERVMTLKARFRDEDKRIADALVVTRSTIAAWRAFEKENSK